MKTHVIKNKGLSLFLAILIAVGTIPTAMLANTAEASAASLGAGVKGTTSNGYLGKGSDGKYFYNKHYSGNHQAIKFGLKTSQGAKTVFCIDASDAMDNGWDYKAKKADAVGKLTSENKIKGAMLFGYGSKYQSGVSGANGNDWYAATQAVIWNEAGLVSSHSKAYKCYKLIKERTSDYLAGPSFKSKTIKLKYSYAQKAFVGSVKDTSENRFKTKFSGQSAGTTVTRSGNTYTFKMTAGGDKLTLKNDVNNSSQALMIFESTSKTSSRQAVAYGSDDFTSFSMSLTRDAPGTAKIVKTSDNGKVSGITFNISGNGLNQNYTTNTDGVITASIYPGAYTVKEVLTEEQLKTYATLRPQSITITEGGIATVNFKNELLPTTTGISSITKITDDGGPVEGYTFNINGVGSDGKDITANDIVTKSKATGATDIRADADDVKAINEAIKKSETGEFKVHLTGKVEETDDNGEIQIVDKKITVKVNLKNVEDDVEATSNPEGDGFIASDFDYAGSATKVNKDCVTDNIGTIVEEIPFGTYIITEKMTKEQALRYEQPESQTIILTEKHKNAQVTFINKAQTGELDIKKTSEDNIISGVTFKVEGKTSWGEEIEPFEVETDDEGLISNTIMPGTYTVTELGVDGVDEDIYIPQEPQTVEVRNHETTTVEFYNRLAHRDVEISKVSESNGVELPGAELSILDKDNNVVEKWTSTTETHIVKGLKFGETYTLHEDLAPIGYNTASDIEFTVDDTDQKITMLDEVQKVKIIKKDAGDGEYLGGAKLQILDQEGNVVDKFTSGAEAAHEAALTIGEAYTLHEVKAPKGYVLAEDVPFVFSQDGQEVEMLDKPNSQLKTTATVGGKHEANPSKETILVDKIIYTNLSIGKEYTMKGTLMNQKTNKPLEVHGRTVTAEKTFTPNSKNGYVEMTFKFDSSAFTDTSTVVFEDCYRDGIKVVSHADIKDKGQTVKFKKGRLILNYNENNGGYGDVRTGDYSNLIPFMLILLVSGGTVVALLLRKKGHSNE